VELYISGAENRPEQINNGINRQFPTVIRALKENPY
jgi:hypothetical protein